MPIIRDNIPSDGSVTTAKIANGAIAASKLADLPYSVVVTGWQPPNSVSTAATTIASASCAYNVETYQNNINNWMEWAVWCAAGTYTLRIVYPKNNNEAIFSIAVDGSTLATTIDGYNATYTKSHITDITGIVLTAGLHTVRFTGASKNASSTGYQVTLHGFSLTRTGA